MSSRAAFQSPRKPICGTVTSFDGTTIAYDLYDQPSRSVIVVIPGFWRERRHPSMLRVAGFLNDAGYAAAVCDLRGHGESEGVFGFNLSEHHDIDSMCQDLLERRAFEGITLMGFSYGGAVAISTAARHALPIASLLLVSPVADSAMVSPRINLLTIHRHVAFGQAFRRPRFDCRFGRTPRIRAVDDVSNINAPICLIHVKDDWLIDHSHSVTLYEHASDPKELHILDIPGNYHADRIFGVAAERIDPLLTGFLSRHTPK